MSVIRLDLVLNSRFEFKDLNKMFLLLDLNELVGLLST